ncbi:hypothetical protein [Microbacterium invictum]|uniref:Uncharacterized protein n=1 Tax=Microbacterium invictum TaxID=515415 RepID=A0AA40SPR9_9MICO|nr:MULTISPECIES: hypothetical protein [Microbacterium]MBB4140173.1 hypothetical protein [Microbacterium invictum]
MRILLKLVLDCDADAAWRALHSPRAIAELYGPLVDMTPLATPPTALEPGADLPVQLRLAGMMSLGRQLIHISERYVEDWRGPVRILRDSGIPLTGPLASLEVWDHQMAVSPAPGDPSKTLWRDRLVIGGGAALPLWPVLWATWQWRAARLRMLAPSWAFDPEFARDLEDVANVAAGDAEAGDAGAAGIVDDTGSRGGDTGDGGHDTGSRGGDTGDGGA